MTIVDVRILVEGASDVEVVSKALQGLALGSEYNITISAIIPTTNVEIAKSAAAGADLLIIATDADRVGRDLAERLYTELSEMVGHVERMKIPLGHDLEHIDVELVRKELKNTLVRAGLKSLQVLPEYMALRNQLLDIKGRYDGLSAEYHNLKGEYEKTLRAYEEIKKDNERLKEENEGLKALIENAKNIFSIEEAWKSLFPAEPVPGEAYIGKAAEKLGLGGRVIVGQGYIFAEDRNLVDELLRTVYLSLTIREEPEPPEPPTPPEKQEEKKKEGGELNVVEDAEVKPEELESLLKGL